MIDVFNIINSRLRIFYTIIIICISILAFLIKAFDFGIMNLPTENISFLYYFIPVAVSSIFSFILFPVCIEAFNLFCSTRLSFIKRIQKKLDDFEEYNFENEISGTTFPLSIIFSLYSFVLLYPLFTSTAVYFNRPDFIFYFKFFTACYFIVLFIALAFTVWGYSRHICELISKEKSFKKNYFLKLKIKNMLNFLEMFFVCFVLHIFSYSGFIELFVLPCIDTQISGLILKNMRDILVLLPFFPFN